MVAIISNKEIGVNFIEDICLYSPKSLLKQSYYNKSRKQKDGWGIAYYLKEKALIFKSKNPIFKERKLIEKKIKQIQETQIFIAHIRDASNPKKLPHKKLISINNTQPFSCENIVFTHNGTLLICDEIYARLGKYKKYVKGVNDSEILFWEFIKMLNAYGSIPLALEMTRDEINTIWFSVGNDLKTEGITLPYRGLNIFVSDGRKFYALCDYKLNPPRYSIMTPKWEWGKYAIKENGDVIIISSEPLDNSKWQKVDFPIILTIDKNVKITKRKLK